MSHAERLEKAGDKLHIIFLFASPIVFTDVDGSSSKIGYQTIPVLDFCSHSKAIKAALKDSGKQYVFKSEPGTK